MTDSLLYRTIWRWHFYAGLFVLILSVTGAVYLFKPQIDRWEERAYRGLGSAGAVEADRQVAAVAAAHPGTRVHHYRLAEQAGDAAMVEVGLPGGGRRDVYVSPQRRVLGALDPESRISEMVALFHGSLLIGTWGDRLVELPASWTIVMILTGLYLWWPRRSAWRAASGPGFPCADGRCSRICTESPASGLRDWCWSCWPADCPGQGRGAAFNCARTELGLVQGPQNWKTGAGGGGHAGHGGGASHNAPAPAARMAFPVLILPPHAPQRFGPPTGNVWTVKSETQNRRWRDRT